MEIIYHIIGLCPDAHSHFDILDIIATWDSVMSYISRVSFLFFKIKLAILEFLK